MLDAPADTPATQVADIDEQLTRLSAEIGKLVALPETRDKLEGQGFDPFYNDPEQTAAMLRTELVKFEKLIKFANIRAEQ